MRGPDNDHGAFSTFRYWHRILGFALKQHSSILQLCMNKKRGNDVIRSNTIWTTKGLINFRNGLMIFSINLVFCSRAHRATIGSLMSPYYNAYNLIQYKGALIMTLLLK